MKLFEALPTCLRNRVHKQRLKRSVPDVVAPTVPPIEETEAKPPTMLGGLKIVQEFSKCRKHFQALPACLPRYKKQRLTPNDTRGTEHFPRIFRVSETFSSVTRVIDPL
jgi:hypothetical protein